MIQGMKTMLDRHRRFNSIRLCTILIAASSLLLLAFAQPSMALSGQVDTRFGSNGSTTLTGYDPFMPQRDQVAVAPNGSFAVVGSIGEPARKSVDGTYTFDGQRWSISLYAKNGTLDTRFGEKGRVILRLPGERADYPRSSSATAVSFDRRGRLLVAGAIDHATFAEYQLASSRSSHELGFGDVQRNRLGLIRLTKSGRLDHSFGARGVTQVDLEDRDQSVRAVGIGELPGGRIVVGESIRYGWVNAFAFTPAGKHIRSFGARGKTRVKNASALRVGTDGSIFAGGIKYVGPSAAHQLHVWSVTRLKADGRTDKTYGKNGVAEIRTKYSTKYAFVAPSVETMSFDLAPISAGRVLVTAAQRHGSKGHAVLAVARLGSRGRLDSSFGASGVARAPLGPNTSSSGASVVMNRAGEIYAGGTFDQTPFNDRYAVGGRPYSQGIVAKFDKRGKPDLKWGARGVQRMARAGVESCPFGPQLTIQATRVLASGCWREATGEKPAEVFRLRP